MAERPTSLLPNLWCMLFNHVMYWKVEYVQVHTVGKIIVTRFPKVLLALGGCRFGIRPGSKSKPTRNNRIYNFKDSHL